jgi:hemoglobin
MPKEDISNLSDIEFLVNTFYNLLINNIEVNHHFKNLNLSQHLPHIVNFWALVLLDIQGYTSNVFEKHKTLELQKKDFEIWLQLWSDTVTQNFEGPKATLAVERAKLISFTFQSKLGL